MVPLAEASPDAAAILVEQAERVNELIFWVTHYVSNGLRLFPRFKVWPLSHTKVLVDGVEPVAVEDGCLGIILTVRLGEQLENTTRPQVVLNEPLLLSHLSHS
jgi:hypothetical protein